MQILRFPFVALDTASGPFPEAELPPAAAEVEPEISAEEAFRTLPQQLAMTQEELAAKEDSARADGFAKGYAEGVVAGQGERAALEKHALETEKQLAMLLATIQNMYQEAAAEIGRAVQELSGAIALKLAGRALQEKPEEAILGMVESLLPNLLRQPELKIEVHPELADRLQEKIIRLSSEAGFTGQLHVVASAAVAESDCRLEWVTGTAVLNQAALQAKVKELLGLTI